MADKAAIKTELQHLKDNYKFKTIHAKSFPFIFSVLVEPIDEFPLDSFDGLQIEFSMSSTYPNEEVVATKVLGVGDGIELPAELAKKILQQINSIATQSIGKLHLQSTIDYIQSHLRDLVIDSKFVEQYIGVDSSGASCRRYILLKNLVVTVAPSSKQEIRDDSEEEDEEEEYGDGGRDWADSDDENEGEDDEGEEDETMPIPLYSLIHANEAAPGAATTLLLEGVDMENISVLECSTLNIMVSCNACTSRTPLSLQPGQDSEVPCPTCGPKTLLQGKYHPLPVTQSSFILGWIQLFNCQFFDVFSSPFSVLCFECSALNRFDEIKLVLRNQSNCQHCHHRMTLTIGRVKRETASETFGRSGSSGDDSYSTSSLLDAARCRSKQNQKKKSSGSSSGGGGASSSALASNIQKAKALATAGLTVGQPLPDKGTCKHYHKSYRWLGFPCCVQLGQYSFYPCDLCHEEKADHEMRMANRMICGYCSTEQKCAGICVNCAKVLSSSARKEKVAANSASGGDKFKGAFKTISKKARKNEAQRKK